jgi:NADH-quinone oxidoreductase subunit A
VQPIVTSGLLSPWKPGLTSMIFYSLAVLALTAAFLFLCGRFATKRETPEKLRPYECGIIPTGLARFRYPVPFYLVAVFFLVFDVEAVYIFSWAIAFEGLGWSGWVQISFFIAILLISLFYIWSKGGLEWRPTATGNSRTPGKHS